VSARPILYGDVSRWGLVEADTLALLPLLPPASVDVVVTDPPYGISFGGRAWDGRAICEAASARRSDSPNEAFERWTARWAAGCLRLLKPGGHLLAFGAPRTFHRLVAGIEDAGLEVRDQLIWLNGQGMPKSRRIAGGLGTALKPAYEPILLARRPVGGRLEATLARWGTGALNIDAGRSEDGRWPPNVVLSHGAECSAGGCVADCPSEVLDAADRELRPSRFFYCSKASRREREAGCEDLAARRAQIFTGVARAGRTVRNIHPTVKPIELMRWLVRLACPPGGVVLDPFCGSGSTGAAALLEGRQFVGIEREPDYVEIARARLDHWAAQDGRSA
jgi:site-specific DNA-methyltransferase (adenine-specific)